ncbi:MAG: bifunctional acetate--CoA ligase family protein/GNAT family N-acetyltransferase [Caulobacteraceae bacterium]|nr:bifunctional acetate--CoA ligase family protein/GNAT family N-acetyltransferase [Caulobacteraceae bacterium]
MTTRNFDALFAPKAIAVIGASNHPHSVGAVLARNMFAGGFMGPILAVNPHETAIQSTLSYNSVADLPLTPDLAVIATPPGTVPGLIAELGAKGCRAAVVVTAGFGEGGAKEGEALRDAMLEAGRPYMMRIVGPNCLGFMTTGAGINASFAHLAPAKGDIAFLSQSGAVLTSVLDWAAGKGVGFSHIVSLGDMSDVDFGDLLDYLAQDQATRSILLYVESVKSARKFMTAARIAARAKPVIVIKSGRSASGAKAAMSHTGAMAGSDAVYDAVFRRAGMLRVTDLREVFEAAETLKSRLTVRGDRLAILTNGGGVGVLAADALEARGGRLASLSPDVIEALNAVLPSSWSHGVPVDILGDASGERYTKAITALLHNKEQDAILVMNCPTGVVEPNESVEAVIAAAPQAYAPPVITCWLGEATASAARAKLSAAGLPAYETPDEAVRAFMHLVEYRRNQDLLLETPATHTLIGEGGQAAARKVVEATLADGRSVLSEAEAKQVLAAYGVPVVETRIATNPAEAAALARTMPSPVAIKILSPDITHKSDVGGVRLNLRTPDEVEAAARAMIEQVAYRLPDARITGVTVQPMVTRPTAHELIVGLIDDATFGPVLLFGQGGTAVEVIADRALGLPPLNSVLARAMIDATRVSKLLKGYRDRPAADVDAIADVLQRLSDLVIDLPEVVELDINPLLADDKGVIALDARIVVRKAPANGDQRLAIRPYPANLEQSLVLPKGRTVKLRPVRPQDEPGIVDLIARSAPEDVRMRFFSVLKTLPHQMAARLSQIDYDREMAFAAVDKEGDAEAIVGVVRIFGDPDRANAEYAIMVRSDWKGEGLGYRLLAEMLTYARKAGYAQVWGEVLSENTRMLTMARDLGGAINCPQPSQRTVRVEFDLTKAAATA